MAHLGLRRMVPRDPDQAYRAASPLELFFDLVFVVAVSFSSIQLHHLQAEGHVAAGVGSYLLVFFAIWWAWMNFTWFASAFDTDDWLYRVLVILQMSGVLVLAAGTRDAMKDQDFTLVTVGYVVMRLAMVAQWLRAAHSDHELRATALRFAAGIFVVQCLWVARLALPEEWGLVSFLLLVGAELAVPAWAERHRPTPWHSGHIAERFGLFTLILLGESILASANALVDAIDEQEHLAPLLLTAACAMVLASGMWWLYFARDNDKRIVGSLRSALIFGYGHYLVFAAAGAFSAGIEVIIDHVGEHTQLSTPLAYATLTVPVSLFVLGTWALSLRPTLTPARSGAVAILGLAIALTALLPGAIAVAAALVVAAVVLVETSPAPVRNLQEPARRG